MSEIRNAQIKSTRLGTEDHGIFTAYVMVEGDGWGCGFGGYAFDTYNKETKKRVGHSFGMAFIHHLMETVGVERWEKLPGTYVRVDTEGWGGKILRIGHITKEQWFDPKSLAEEFAEREKGRQG